MNRLISLLTCVSLVAAGVQASGNTMLKAEQPATGTIHAKGNHPTMMTKFVRVNDNISTTTAPNMDTSNSMISTTEKYDYDLALTAISGLPTMLPISQDWKPRQQ